VLSVTAPLDPAICPLCGEPNACGMAAGTPECWCLTETIPTEVLDRVPPEAKGGICVCRACATGRLGTVTVQPRLKALLSGR
jgi:hypothetical protein